MSLPSFVQRLPHDIYAIDTGLVRDRFDAAYLVLSAGRAAFVDTGTAHGVPRLRADQDPEFITGQPPSLINLPTSCRFAPRCPKRFGKCDQEPPVIEKDGRKVKCWLYA